MNFKEWLLTEDRNSVQGLDQLIQNIKNRHPNISNNLINKIEEFIINSDIKRIQIAPLQMALGASLLDRVIINSSVFHNNLPTILYVIFHEIAHQYQYKKHGFANMFKYFQDDLNIRDAVKILRKGEVIADNYAIRKLQRLKLDGENIDTSILRSYYKAMSDSTLANYISMVKKTLKGENAKDPKHISNTLYNLVMPNAEPLIN